MLMRGAITGCITERYVNPYDFPLGMILDKRLCKTGMILDKRLCKNELSETHTSQPHKLTVPLPPFWTVNFKHSKCKTACWDHSKKSLAMNCNYPPPPPQFQAKNKLDNERSLSELQDFKIFWGTPPYTLAPPALACEPPQFKIRSAIPVNCNITQFEKRCGCHWYFNHGCKEKVVPLSVRFRPSVWSFKGCKRDTRSSSISFVQQMRLRNFLLFCARMHQNIQFETQMTLNLEMRVSDRARARLPNMHCTKTHLNLPQVGNN